MLKSCGIILAFAASGMVGVQAPAEQVGTARTGPDCTAVFRANQSTIETLAGQGDTAEIQAIFVRAGCAAPSVGLPTAQPRGAKAAKPKIRCRFKLLPPSLICTF
ncbi:MAG: hypothetical protein Q8J89_16175 [Caulobacter sp.]|nr:hypothetical protein [Caulobacter sp.]